MSLATQKPLSRIQPKIPADTFYRYLDTLGADTYYPLCFAAIDVTTGYAKKFDGSNANQWFDGVWDIDSPYKLDAVNAGVTRLRVTRPEYIEIGIPAGGLTVLNLFQPVYAVSGNDYQGQLTAPTSGFTESIGTIMEVVSPTAVLMQPRYKKQTSFGSGSLSVLSFPIELASVAAGNVVNGFTPGFAGKIRSLQFVANKPATTASKAATLSAKINSTAVTGGAVALTSANCTPQGNVVAGTAVTAANQFGPTDTLTIVAASVTAFAEGNGTLQVVIEAAANN